MFNLGRLLCVFLEFFKPIYRFDLILLWLNRLVPGVKSYIDKEKQKVRFHFGFGFHGFFFFLYISFCSILLLVFFFLNEMFRNSDIFSIN